MSPRSPWLFGFAALSLVLVTNADAQRRAGSERTAAQPQPAATPAVPADTNVMLTSLALRRDAVEQMSQQLGAKAAPSAKDRGIMGSMRKTFGGDKHQVDAAKRVLAQQAVALGKDGKSTVIVVIGTAEDRDKVVESLAGVRRKVRVAFVDRDSSDATVDNTVLSAGVAGAVVTDAATNLWVHLPKANRGERDKPDRTLSTRIAGPTLWNGLFAADGDALDVDQLRSAFSRSRGADSSAAEPEVQLVSGNAPAVVDAGAPKVGDVVAPKIGNVKVYADASSDSKVVGTVAKTDELVVVAASKNGFLKVQGASTTGWVSEVMLTKPVTGGGRLSK